MQTGYGRPLGHRAVPGETVEHPQKLSNFELRRTRARASFLYSFWTSEITQKLHDCQDEIVLLACKSIPLLLLVHRVEGADSAWRSPGFPLPKVAISSSPRA